MSVLVSTVVDEKIVEVGVSFVEVDVLGEFVVFRAFAGSPTKI